MDTRTPLTALVALAAAAAVGVAGCKKEVSVSIGHSTLKSKDMPFTFEYPVNWDKSPAKHDTTGVMALVNRSGDTLNLIDVRRAATTKVAFGDMKGQLKDSFGSQGLKPGKMEVVTREGREFLTFTLDNTVSGKKTRSTMYYFTGDGATWQIECQSTTKHRSEVARACKQAVDSIDFK